MPILMYLLLLLQGVLHWCVQCRWQRVSDKLGVVGQWMGLWLRCSGLVPGVQCWRSDHVRPESSKKNGEVLLWQVSISWWIWLWHKKPQSALFWVGAMVSVITSYIRCSSWLKSCNSMHACTAQHMSTRTQGFRLCRDPTTHHLTFNQMHDSCNFASCMSTLLLLVYMLTYVLSIAYNQCVTYVLHACLHTVHTYPTATWWPTYIHPTWLRAT